MSMGFDELELAAIAHAYASGSTEILESNPDIDPRTLIGSALKRGWVSINLILDLTRVCNSRCITCGIWRDANPPTLSLQDADLVFQRILKINQVYVTGGEPYLVPHLVDIAAALHHRHPQAVWSGDTNALDPNTYDVIQKIRDMGIAIRVGVSLEGNEQIHDRIRGVPGNYHKAVELIYRLQKEGIPVAISSLTLAGIREAERLGVPASRGIYRTGNRFHSRSKCPTVQMRNCPGLKRWMVVTPTGDIYPCEVYSAPLKVGNIRDSWDSLEFARVASYIDGNLCSSCTMHCYIGK